MRDAATTCKCIHECTSHAHHAHVFIHTLIISGLSQLVLHTGEGCTFICTLYTVQCMYIVRCTVELLNNGHIGSGSFVLYMEVVPLQKRR